MTEPASQPIRTAEVSVASYQWDAWQHAAVAASARARRTAAVVAVVVGLVAGVAGVAWLPGDARLSVALYVPFVVWASWAWTRAALADRGFGDAVEGVRQVVVPALVDSVDADTLISLLRHGGGLVTSRSTVISSHRTDSLVVLVASEYDARALPPPVGGAGGGGWVGP